MDDRSGRDASLEEFHEDRDVEHPESHPKQDAEQTEQRDKTEESPGSAPHRRLIPGLPLVKEMQVARV